MSRRVWSEEAFFPENIPTPGASQPSQALVIQPPRTSELFHGSLRGDGSETFFPKLPLAAVYEITVSGVLQYDVTWEKRTWTQVIPCSAKETIDAFYKTNDAGRFVNSHHWLLVCNRALCWREHEKLAWDRGSHLYQFVVEVTGETLGIALQPGTWYSDQDRYPEMKSRTSDRLTVTVRALPGYSRLAEWKAERAPAKPKAKPETAATPKPTVQEIQERMKRRVEVSGRDFTTVLLAIGNEFKAMATAIEQQKDIPADIQEALFQEAKAWAARQLEELAGDGKGGGSNVKTI